MTYEEKLEKIITKLKDERDLTRKGYKTKVTFNDNSFTKVRIEDICKLLLKLQDDEKILKIIDAYEDIENFDPYDIEKNDNYEGVEGIVVEIDETFDKWYSEYSETHLSQQDKQYPTELSLLHSSIATKCESLYKKQEYAEAVEKSFKVVRDRLRELTGYETGSEAFGKGKIHIKGAAAANVTDNFNAGVKFLTMAVDRFRNEKSHTADAKIENPQRAYEYLTLSSLAMNLLDQAEIRSM